MKNLSVLLLIVLLGNISIAAQSTIEGSIMNAKGESLQSAVVTMQHTKDVELNKAITTDENGYFIMDDLVDGDYILVVENADYQTLLIDNFEFPKDADKVVGLTLENLELLTPTDITTKRNAPKNNIAVATVY